MALESTPSRRSVMLTPVQRLQQNDDEAERQLRRSNATDGRDESSATDNANLQRYLQMYTDNKFNKDNAWDVNVIDHFSNMLAKHHKMLTNFQVVGSSLEASAKVYVLRVDSLHTDTMRMASELSRQATKKVTARNADDNDDEGVDKENDETGLNGDSQQPKTKRKRPARQVATVTKNKETLNAKLDTNPFTDPFFAQLNSIVGDVNASNRLMQNIIPSKDGELRLRMDNPCWDPTPHPELNFDDDEKYVDIELQTVSMNTDLSEHLALHQRLKGYRITDTPAEDDDEPNSELELSNRSLNGSTQRAAVIFDPNAEVEQVSQANDYVMDFDADFGVENGHVDFNDLTEEERTAIEACKGLRRMPVVIEDMRPVDANSSQLEYSYRPLEMISQFWAGPSHWKYRRLRSSVQKKSMAAVSEEGVQQVAAKKKRAPRKKRFEPATLDQILNFQGSDVFQKRDRKKPIKSITYSKMYISRKWNQKKLKLPTKLELERDMFTKLQFAPSLNVAPVNPRVEPEIPTGDYNYNNNADQDYCMQLNVETDAETDTDFGGEPDHANTSDENLAPEMLPPNQTLDIIPTEFADAPQKIEKIILAYAKRAKPVDMKQLKSGCWRIINEVSSKATTPVSQLSEENGGGSEPMESQSTLHFKEVYEQLPKILTKSMAENISVGLVFYSLLHLANEKGLKLQMHNDLEDFSIIMPDTER